ncbi:39S ribosomal mitochondrial [Brachionus plicatilis]|uniref:Large ribosomal subunit protein mL49 n=1 Tax=Brachionus plicatilis TaxID=10195 RepID=A0A3M7PIT2_BRAPC|nr:39S ribosomal mitochondrial [Brachionus plicatilis]
MHRYLIKLNKLNATMVNPSVLVAYSSNFSKLSERKPLPSRPINLEGHEFTSVTESKEEFKYVKKLLPSLVVPDPPEHDFYPTPSGWVPPNNEKCSKFPYFVLRTRFHNFPIYALEREGGSRKLVKIKRIEGDIWKFDEDLRNYVEKCIEKNEDKKLTIYSQVNEVQRQVMVKGHYQDYISKFLIECGF